MGYWLGIAFSCLDVLCVAVFCDAFLERKTRGLRFVVGVLLYGVLSYIATVFVSHISEESPITLLKFAALILVAAAGGCFGVCNFHLAGILRSLFSAGIASYSL